MNFPELAQEDMNAKMQKVQVHQVIPILMYSLFMGEEDKKFKVKLK